MAIGTYTQLQDAIADWMIRADLPFLDRLTDFIQLAEGKLSRLVRTRDMETNTTLTLNAAGKATLPSDYLEWISAQMVSSGLYLRYVEPDTEDWRFRFRPNGAPQMFSIIADKLVVRPLLAADVELSYYQDIPALSTVSTNWLLTRAPDLYLHLSLFEAWNYQQDEEKAAPHWQIAQQEMQRLNGDADTNKVARRPFRTAETAATMTARAPETRPS